MELWRYVIRTFKHLQSTLNTNNHVSIGFYTVTSIPPPAIADPHPENMIVKVEARE